MKKNLRTVFITALALVFLCGLSYSQSRETGALQGVVTDTEGTPLPGVEVTINSPSMMGGAKSTITDASGKYRFVLLLPGTYSIDVKLEGFAPKRREAVRLFVAQTLTVDFSLEIGTLEEEVTVLAQSPLIDVKDTAMLTTVLDARALDNIVYNREMYIYKVIELAPGTTPVYHGSSAYGGEGRAGNTYYLDGVEISIPGWGDSWHIPNAQSFEEVKVTGLGAAAEYDGFTGVHMTMISKSGGNTYDGMAQIMYTDYGWVDANFDVDEHPLWEEPQETMFQDAFFQIGGPIIKDKLWLFADVKWLSEGFLTGAGAKYRKDQPKHLAKLTFQLSPATRITATQSFDDWVYDERYTSVYRPVEASSYEYCHTYVHSLGIFHSFSDKTFMDVRLGRIADSAVYGGYQGDTPGHHDDSTGMYSGNYKWVEDWPDWRWQVTAHLSHHADEFIEGSHDFKFGVEWEQVGAQEIATYNGGYWYEDNVLVGGVYHNYAYTYGYDRKPVGNRYSAFAQDSWTIGNVTINPGIRFNYWTGYLTSWDATPFKTSGIAPRIGITWDIFGDHTTAFKAHYGKYYDKLVTNVFSAASTGTNDWVMYEVMPDGTKDEVDRDVYTNPTTVDEDIIFQSMDQFSFGIERELMKDISVGASFIWKKRKNYIAMVNTGVTYDLVSFTYTDENGVEQTGQAYDKTSDPEQDRFLLTNPKEGTYPSVIKDPYRTYWGLFFTFEKRFSNRWMLAANYALSMQKSTYLGRDPWIDPNETLWTLWDGEPVGYAVHNFKIFATVVLPFDFNLSPMFVYRTGPRWTRYIHADVTGSPDYIIEKPRINKLDDVYIFDLRLEKTFTVKGDLRVGLLVDLYNVFNVGREEAIQNYIHSANYGLIDEFNFGRRYKIGLRVYF